MRSPKTILKNFIDRATEVLPQHIDLSCVDVWFQDETRVGQQGSLTRIWAKKGTRPRVVRQQQFISQYIFGAVCPAQGQAAGLILPCANSEGLELHLAEISKHVPADRHALVIMDQAGWHHTKNMQVPENISIIHLPPYSPELNAQENIWQHLKDAYLSNRVFHSRAEILEACVSAWNSLAASAQLISSISHRSWALF